MIVRLLNAYPKIASFNLLKNHPSNRARPPLVDTPNTRRGPRPLSDNSFYTKNPTSFDTQNPRNRHPSANNFGTSNTPNGRPAVSSFDAPIRQTRGAGLFKLLSKFFKRDVTETRFAGNDANHLYSVSVKLNINH